MNIRIAIVIPILNESASLPDLLLGIDAQLLQPREIVFVDAGSTDGSQLLIREWARNTAFAERTVSVLELPGGLPGSGRNAGVSAAKSEWIAFIDGGIIPEPDWLERLVACVRERGTKATFGLCDFESDDPFGRAICALTYGYKSRHPVLPASLFHRDTLDAIGPFRDDLRAAEDILWMRRFVDLFGALPVCPDARVHYRHFPDNVASAFRKWRENESNAVRAGVRGSQHAAYLLGLPVLLALPFFAPVAGLFLILVYLFLRGVVDPIRRSAVKFWWQARPSAFFIAIGTAALIDISKCLGIAQGLLERATRKNNKRERAPGPSLSNVDAAVVAGFGDEWTRMPQNSLSAGERNSIFDEYFDVFPWQSLPPGSTGADIGCGSGRWARLASEKCGALHVVDASVDALAVARANLSTQTNVTFHHASVGKLPFDDASLDFAYSLGVLHHVPDHLAAIKEIARTLKPGAPFLVYLYYAFDNRPRWFRAIWEASNVVRLFVSRMPHFLRFFICQCLAAAIYWPLARIGAFLDRKNCLPAAWPLAYYRDKSFYTMRTDALDRFGTRLEKRFTRKQIETLLGQSGFKEIRFSDSPPFWCAVATRNRHSYTEVNGR